MTALSLKPPPSFVKNEWAWAYTLDKLTGKGQVDEAGNPLNYAAAVAIYKRVCVKYGDANAAPAPATVSLTRAELLELYSDTWLVSRGFAWAANDRFTARVFRTDEGWQIERIDDAGDATTARAEFDTVFALMRDAPKASTWVYQQEHER